MKRKIWCLIAAGSLLAVSVLSGCGSEDDDASPPPTALTASVVASAPATADNHTHSVSIQFTDPGSAAQVSYQSSLTAGHTHTIALSSAQFNDLKAGMQVIVTSTTANGHSHTWTILGGSYLYDSICYNCHTNSKRGTRGMSSNNLTSAQRDSLQNPSAAPVSTSPAVYPNTAPTNAPPTVSPLDGAALYGSYCAGCHGALSVSTKRGRTATQIRNAISANSGGMGGLSGLTDAQLQAISTVLQ